MKQSSPPAKTETTQPEGPGPRMQMILQARIAPWKRDKLGDEEAQLAEIKRRPVRNRYDAEEAKRRLAAKPAKKSRTARNRPGT